MIKAKREVLSTIKMRHRTQNGKPFVVYECYLGADATGKKIRLSRNTREELIDTINAYYRDMKTMGDARVVLKPAQIYDAKQALDILRDNCYNISLTDCIRAYVARRKEEAKILQTPLGVAYRAYYDSIPEQQAMHRKSIVARVSKWVYAFGGDRAVSEVTEQEFVKYLAQFKNDTTYNNVLTYCKTFLNWCCAKSRLYISHNPLEDLKPRRIVYETPEFAPAADVRAILKKLVADNDIEAIIYTALSFFCGIRFAEIERIGESEDGNHAIDLGDGTVRIEMPKGWTQGMAPRVFRMEENALTWLRYCGREALTHFSALNARLRMHHAATEIGITFPHNAGRHSFITYHVAKYELPERTEAIVGTSKAMRARHYQGLVKKSEAEEYFSIVPEA